MINIMEKQKKAMIRIIPGERFTPYSLYLKLGARALLESASLVKGRGRYSIILIKDAFTIFQKGREIYMEKEGKVYSIKSKINDILDLILYFANQHRGLDYGFPLPAGGVGYLSYEYASHFDDINLMEKKDIAGIPDASFIIGHTFLVFDHYTDTISLIALNYKEHEVDLERSIENLERRIHDLDFNYLNPSIKDYTFFPLTLDDERGKFLKGVEKVRREICKGNLLQGVLSRKVVLRTDIPALDAYRRLRSLNPSPYMFYLDFKGFQLFGSSPEIHVKVHDRKVIMRPIAGTRRRGKDKTEDQELEKELISDEKERAEHLMLIDLARNDLGRVCEPGSIEVTEYMGIERYSHVMHIVSQVEGILQNKKYGIEAIRKTFPAGTVAGAPKIRAIETIDSIEMEKRGFYAGIVGYIEPDGNLDTCITIRSALKKDDILILQAGAGVVYDSIPEKEYDETSSKLRALGKAIGVEV